MVISYTVPVAVTKNTKTKEQAENDSKPAPVLKNTYKNICEMGDDEGLRLSELLFLPIGM